MLLIDRPPFAVFEDLKTLNINSALISPLSPRFRFRLVDSGCGAYMSGFRSSALFMLLYTRIFPSSLMWILTSLLLEVMFFSLAAISVDKTT